MKQTMINYMQQEKNDELYTPNEAILPILKYLDHNKIYWECTDFGESNITKVLKEKGFKVIHTSKNEVDFLKDEPNFNFDLIITNPPYSLKNEFLRKCYEYNKPFALLLPLTALEGKERGKLYREKGIEVIVLDKRINFMKEKKNIWFNTSWFCHRICDQLLNFECVGGEDDGKGKVKRLNRQIENLQKELQTCQLSNSRLKTELEGQKADKQYTEQLENILKFAITNQIGGMRGGMQIERYGIDKMQNLRLSIDYQPEFNSYIIRVNY